MGGPPAGQDTTEPRRNAARDEVLRKERAIRQEVRAQDRHAKLRDQPVVAGKNCVCCRSVGAHPSRILRGKKNTG